MDGWLESTGGWTPFHILYFWIRPGLRDHPRDQEQIVFRRCALRSSATGQLYWFLVPLPQLHVGLLYVASLSAPLFEMDSSWM